jgi:translation initiation factor 1 (eIF-1/SUI1)
MDSFVTSNQLLLPEEEKNISITKEKRGRKTNIFISGWDISLDDKKTHLKKFKNKFGCNGSVKDKLINSVEENVIHLQGEHTDKIIEYLCDNGVDKSKIIVKI